MNPTPDLDRVFPLSGGSAEPARLRAPHVLATINVTPALVMGNRAFMRAWAARRLAARASAAAATADSPGPRGEFAPGPSGLDCPA
jgi:hypothetical protein